MRGGALVGVLLVALALGGVPAGAAAGAPAPGHSTSVWALARTSDGRLRVVRGAAVARETRVVSIEDDAAVHALGTNDPLRPQEWALDRVPFETAWTATRTLPGAIAGAGNSKTSSVSTGPNSRQSTARMRSASLGDERVGGSDRADLSTHDVLD